MARSMVRTFLDAEAAVVNSDIAGAGRELIT